ncbi:MAG: hypothetical protein FWC62_07265 [Firmicutes bacterium]|nr:hypothetical protein [Bacillota bacterium]
MKRKRFIVGGGVPDAPHRCERKGAGRRGRRPLLVWPLVLLLTLLLSGCGMGGSIYDNYRAIENLQLVTAVGIDREESGDMRLSSCSQLGEDEDKRVVLSAAAPSLTEALLLCQDYAPRVELFYAHAGVAVFGEEALKQGIGETLDFMERGTQFRPGLHLFALRGGSASELFEGRAGSKFGVADVLSTLEESLKKDGRGFASAFDEVAKDLSETGVTLLCAVELKDPKEVALSEEEASALAVPAGFAVLKDGKLAGYLSGDTARGVCLFKEKAAHSFIRVEDGENLVTVELTGCKATRKGASIRLNAGAVIIEQSAPRAVTEPAALERLSAEVAQELRRCAAEAVKTSRDLNADFLGLGADRNLPLSLSVDVKIDHGGNLGDPQSVTGGER